MPRRRTNPGNTERMIGTCRICGEFYTTLEGGVAGVCPTCAERHYFTCPTCGRSVPNESGTATSGGRTLCETCAERMTFTCSVCGTVHENNDHDYLTDHEDNDVCDQCWDNYYRCDSCDQYFREDDLREMNGGEYCWRCAAEHSGNAILSYGYKPDPIFHRAEGEPPNSLVLGIELEMDCGNAEAAAERISSIYGGDWLYFKHDSSLNRGAELVTHPISPAVLLSEQGREMWDAICKAALAEGMRSHDTETCGLHVHVNRDYFGTSDVARVLAEYKLLALCDRLFEPMALFSRRKRHKLDQWAGRPNLPLSQGNWVVRARGASALMRSNRYNAVNVQNRDTIEFRLFRGTLKPSTLLATFAFVAGACAYAKQATPSQVERITWYDLCDEVIERCPAGAVELEDYLSERELIVKGA